MSRYTITCPTESRSLPAASNSLSSQQKSVALLDSNKLRLDGRSPDHIRSIYMKTGVVSQATGSAYFENNNTRIICSIYGPRQIPGNDFSDVGKINCEFSYAPFARPLRKKTQDQNQANEEKTISTQIQQAIQASVRVEKFPKCLLDIFVVVLQADGGVLSGAITCASLALSDAGIETYDLVASCSVGCLDSSTIVMDPNATEEQNKSAQVTLALMPSLHEVTAVVQNGVLNAQQISEAMDLCMDGCSKIFALQRQCLVEKAERIMSQKRPLDQASAQE